MWKTLFLSKKIFDHERDSSFFFLSWKLNGFALALLCAFLGFLIINPFLRVVVVVVVVVVVCIGKSVIHSVRRS